MTDPHDDADLVYVAEQVGKSQVRLTRLLDCDTPPDNPVRVNEERMLAQRKERLGLLIESARTAGELASREALLGRVAGAVMGDGRGALATAVLLEAAYPDARA